MPTSTFLNLPPERRARVLEAALDEFAAAPFEAARVNRIVRAAGIAKGSFYQYFDGLFDLFRHLAVDVLGGQQRAWLAERAPASFPSLEAELAWVCAEGLRWALDEPRAVAMGRQLWLPLSPDSPLRPLQDELRAEGLAELRALLERGQRRGEIGAEVQLDLAAAFVQVSLVHGLGAVLREGAGLDLTDLSAARAAAAALPPEALDDAAGQLVRLLFRGLSDH